MNRVKRTLSINRFLPVFIYFCFGLLGLSGIVRTNLPVSRRGYMISCRTNLSDLIPKYSCISVFVRGIAQNSSTFLHLSAIFTNSFTSSIISLAIQIRIVYAFVIPLTLFHSFHFWPLIYFFSLPPFAASSLALRNSSGNFATAIDGSGSHIGTSGRTFTVPSIACCIRSLAIS